MEITHKEFLESLEIVNKYIKQVNDLQKEVKKNSEHIPENICYDKNIDINELKISTRLKNALKITIYNLRVNKANNTNKIRSFDDLTKEQRQNYVKCYGDYDNHKDYTLDELQNYNITNMIKHPGIGLKTIAELKTVLLIAGVKYTE